MSDHPARRTALLVGLLCAATLARAGCSVPEHAASDIREVVVQHGGYEISKAKCELLNRHNLRLAVTGEAAVLSDVSIGWATVRLISNGNVVSSQVQTSTYVNRFAGSSEVAGELLVRAINDAVAGLDFELAAQEVKRKMASR